MIQVPTTEELRECPFCGMHRASMYKNHPTDFYYFVKCRFCGVQTESEYDEKGAARNWNKRKERK